MVTNSANLDKVQVQKKETDTTLASKLSLEAQDAQRAKSATPANAGQAYRAPATPAASTAESHLPGLDFVVRKGRIMDGTMDIWKAALAKIAATPETPAS
jgi:hypothetical protein